MEFIEGLTLWFNNAIEELKNPQYWWQLGALAISILVAAVIHNYYEKYWIQVLEGHKQISSIREKGMRTLRRIIMPITVLIFLLISEYLLALLELPKTLVSIAIPLSLSLATVRFCVFILRMTFPNSPFESAGENVISTTIWLLVMLYILGWLMPVVAALDSFAINLGDVRLSIMTVIKFAAILTALAVISIWFSRVIERKLSSAKSLDASMQVGLLKTTKFFIFMAVFLISLSSVGIDLTAFAVFGGALGVGIGFGLQRIASNFISGFILVFDRSIRPGDVITVGDNFGWVQALRARYMVVRNRDGLETLIPNETFITNEVINWSHSDRQVRIKLKVQVSYNGDPEQAMQLMEQAGNACPRVLRTPAPAARLMEFADSGINLELRIWISDPQNGVANVRSEVNLAIWRLFKEHEIEIPFPQRVLHINTDSIQQAPIPIVTEEPQQTIDTAQSKI